MGIIGGIILIWIVCVVISHIVERIRQGIRDKAAHKVLDDSFDYEKEKADVLAINKKFSFKKTEVKKTALTMLTANHQKKDAWIDFVNSIKEE